MSCPHLPAKHWSSKDSNKLAMAGHSSKLLWPKTQQFLVEPILGARSHIQSSQKWHKGFTNPMLGESVSFPMIGAGQVTCCKKHQWLHSIQHQTPGVRDSLMSRGRSSHVAGPSWTHVLRRLNIIVYSLEPWITLHPMGASETSASRDSSSSIQKSFPGGISEQNPENFETRPLSSFESWSGGGVHMKISFTLW